MRHFLNRLPRITAAPFGVEWSGACSRAVYIYCGTNCEEERSHSSPYALQLPPACTVPI